MKYFYLVFFIYIVNLNAQNTFEKGYFLDDSGARTECLIKNNDWRNNPVAFDWKIDAGAEIRKEKIANVSEFGIYENCVYKRFHVKIDRTSNNVNTLMKGNVPIILDETLFLRLLVAGNANLYEYSESNLSRYFYETKTKPIEQLVYFRYLADADNMAYNMKFRSQLYANVRCANTSDVSFEKIRYEKKDLVQHFINFNNCDGNAITVEPARKHRDWFRLSLTPGAGFGSITIKNNGSSFDAAPKLKSSVFKLGFCGEFTLPYNNGKWRIFINPTYQKFQKDADFILDDYAFVKSTIPNAKINVTYSAIDLPIGVRYYLF